MKKEGNDFLVEGPEDFHAQGTTTIGGSNFTCRWCGLENKQSNSFRCIECKTINGITLEICDWDGQRGQGPGIKVYHNPDNSLFIDFVRPGGKTARYTLSPQRLMELGLLRLFETDPKGKRNP